MPHFLDPQGKLHFLSDEDVADGLTRLLPAGCELATPDEITQAERAATAPDLREVARAALVQSDITVLRCFEDGLALPAAWKTYRTELRAIISAADILEFTLPARPDYPGA